MTYGEIYQQFTEKYPDLKAVDYRPLTENLLNLLLKDYAGIIIQLENGGTIEYIVYIGGK